MNEHLDKQLCEAYPKIFVNRNTDISYSPIARGIKCNDGWYNIVKNLCDIIQQHIDQREERIEWCKKFNKDLEKAKENNWEGWNPAWMKTPRDIPEPVEQVVAAQIKEKFGALRFYYDGGDEYIHGAVTMAEFMSTVTCEVCGKPGRKSNKSNWIMTVCDEHK